MRHKTTTIELAPEGPGTNASSTPARTGFRGVSLLACGLLLGGCSYLPEFSLFDDEPEAVTEVAESYVVEPETITEAAPEAAYVETEEDRAAAIAEDMAVNDPIEPVNRFIFQLNRGLDHVVLRPTALVYRAILPAFAQDAVNNFLHNLKSPVILLNDVLQGEGSRAGDTLSRFIINTTVGFGGIGDPASIAGFARHNEDFGQTLGVWGADEGPYLMLPIFGPSNPRDALGRVVDYFTDPIGYWASETTWVDNDQRDWIQPGRTFAERVDWRSRHMEEVDDLERTSLDYYAAVRNLYRQHRADEIRNNKPNAMPEINSLPPMDDFDDMNEDNSADIGQ